MSGSAEVRVVCYPWTCYLSLDMSELETKQRRLGERLGQAPSLTVA
jgi:hypothetical protein